MNNLKHIFKNGDAVVRLIYINVAVFVVLKLVQLFLQLFNLSSISFLPYLAMPAAIDSFLRHAWTLISYMFLHQGFFHLLFNMLCLFWFGKISLTYLNGKQLVGLYLFGGIVAGLFYLLSYNIFPFYAAKVDNSLLLGASGAIMAIIIVAAMMSPNMEISLLFIGRVKLKWVAIVAIFISLFGITGANAGGELAHIGGAFAGYLFVVLLRKGKDVSRLFTAIINKVVTVFKPKKQPKTKTFHYSKPMNDGDYNRHKAQRSAEIDAILDKIKRSGYDSLSAEEKKKLFER